MSDIKRLMPAYGSTGADRRRFIAVLFSIALLGVLLVGMTGTAAAQSGNSDVLLVDGGKNTDFLDRNGFSFDPVTMSEFAGMSASEFENYSIIWIQPDLSTSEINDLRTGLSTLDNVSETHKFSIAIRVAGNSGSHSDIDFLGTDYDRSLHSSEMFVDSNHPFITGDGFGGHQLTTSNFDNWGLTDHGTLFNMPANRTEILRNSDGVSMFSYEHNKAFVVVDTLTAIDGGWGRGNDSVADNYINWLGNLSVVEAPDRRSCINRRSLSRGQENQQCPGDHTISRGGSREELNRETGRNGDMSRRDRGRGDEGRGR